MKNDFILKYKKLSAPAKASLWFVLCSFVQKAISFMVVPIYTRILSPEEYGNYAVFISWVEILFVFTSLYLSGNTLSVGMVKFEHEQDKYVSSLLGLSLTITALFFIAYCLFPAKWQTLLDMNHVLCVLMLIYLAALPGIRFWTTTQRFRYRYQALVAITLAMTTLTPTLSVILFLYTQARAELLILIKVAVEGTVGFLLGIILFLKGKHFYHKKYWFYGLKANIPLIPYYLSATFLSNIDRIMIRNFCGEEEAGIYAVAHSSAMILLFVNSAMNASLTPWLFQKIKEGKGQENAKVNQVLTLGVMVLNMLLILCAPEVIRFMAPAKYMQAIYVIPPLAASVIFNFVYQQFINVEFYYEENKFTMVTSILAALLNVGLNAYFIPRFGYLAAGYTTFVSYFFFAVFHFICVRYIYRKNYIPHPYFNEPFLLASCIFVIVLMLILVLLYSHIAVRYGLILFAAAVLFVIRRRLMETISGIKKS